jgi:hypothetical protein
MSRGEGIQGGVRGSRDGGAEADIETWQSARGSLVISQPVHGVMVFTYHGHMGASVVPFVERSVARVLQTGVRPDLFIDLEQMTGYDSDYRKAISTWGARMYREFGEVRVFVQSKIVAMGIAVSNLTSAGKMKPTTERARFDQFLGEAIARHSCSGAAPKPR